MRTIAPRLLPLLVLVVGTTVICSCRTARTSPRVQPPPPHPATQRDGRYLPEDAPWYRDISAVPAAADSGAITAWMKSRQPPHGWGTGTMRVDFSIIALEVPDGTAKVRGARWPDQPCENDCDDVPVPLPPNGLVEGGSLVPGNPMGGYRCPGHESFADCHLLLVARGEHRLYEMYRANYDARGFNSGYLFLWDTTRTSRDGRGQQCTSADAAGFPIAPLLFTVEELEAGEIRHAIRFILPNDMIRARQYVAPATHGTRTTGPDTAGPYGFRMRLKASYDVSRLSKPAQVVARALKKYGMLLADGGRIAITAQSDALSRVRYADLGFNSRSLEALDVTDFEVVEDTPTVPVTFDCKRTPIRE